jgi:hypothetical protein
MVTTVFNLSAVDRIEADCKELLADAGPALGKQDMILSKQTEILASLANLTAILTNLVTLLGEPTVMGIDSSRVFTASQPTPGKPGP